MRFSLELFPPIDGAVQPWRRPSSRLHSSFSSPPTLPLPASFSLNLIESKKGRGGGKKGDRHPSSSSLTTLAGRMSEGGRHAGRGELSVAIYSNCCCLKKKKKRAHLYLLLLAPPPSPPNPPPFPLPHSLFSSLPVIHPSFAPTCSIVCSAPYNIPEPHV